MNDNGSIKNASRNGHLELVKYLYETCHANVTDNANNSDSIRGYFDVFKYLHETCHSEVTKETIERAKTEKIKKVLTQGICSLKEN